MTPQEREVLLTVRNDLASGAIAHFEDAVDGTPGFNMEVSYADCGSVCCIGGWMAQRIGIEGYEPVTTYVRRGGKEGDLRPLFFPNHDDADVEVGDDWERITPDQAVHAIDNFLTKGRPFWAEVINT